MEQPLSSNAMVPTSVYYNHSVNYNSQHIVHAGWLMKSPPEKRIWKTKWRRRWFVLKLSGQIPGQYVLEYYVDQSCKKLKGVIDLDQCEQVDAGLQLEIRKENYEHMFDIRTAKRVYYLVAKNEDEMNKWVDCICSVCGLKMEAIQNELSLLPPIASMPVSVDSLPIEDRYSPQPSPSQNDNSPRQSPSLQTLLSIPSLNSSNGTASTTITSGTAIVSGSFETSSQQPSPPITISSSDSSRSSLAASSSLNYIPISECYTGKSETDQEKRQASPPPRPPKPRMLQSVPKSQSSLALFSQDQSPQYGVTPVPLAPVRKCGPTFKPQPVPSNGFKFASSSNAGNGITTSTTTDTLKGNHHSPLSGSQQQNLPPPPAVNRDLKPQRRRNPSQETVIYPFGHPNSRHTLPRPPPSYPIRGDDTRKSFNNHQQFSTLNSRNFQYDKQKFYQFKAPSTIQQFHEPELDYLDLDLESESTNSHSPRHPNDSTNMSSQHNHHNNHQNSITGSINNNSDSMTLLTGSEISDTVSISSHNPIGYSNNNNLNGVSNLNNESTSVYKKVDFIKTKALNDMRMHVDLYRNNDP